MAILLPVLPRQAEYEFAEVAAGGVLRPAWGGPIQPMGRTGDRWAVTVTTPTMDASACGGDLETDIRRGRLTPVVMKVIEADDTPTYGATVQVNGAGQAGTTIGLKGLEPGVLIRKNKKLNLVIAGQHYLYEVTAPVTVPVGGLVALPIWPMIRRSPANNAAVILKDPVIEGFTEMISAPRLRQFGERVLTGFAFRLEERE
ncbi:MAG: hypothetical protein ACT7A5_32115 [Ferrovibrionaceae bacterium]|uniref:hypothetical protein n=1 Tax=Brevundimonas sp. TaxID=1871086 RepID=UPI004034B161